MLLASSVVIVPRAREIVVATDSKVVNRIKSGKLSPQAPECKIHKANSFYWVMAGMTRSKEFDVGDFVSRADMVSGGLSSQVASFVDLASKALKGVLWNKEELEIVFFRFHNSAPELFY